MPATQVGQNCQLKPICVPPMNPPWIPRIDSGMARAATIAPRPAPPVSVGVLPSALFEAAQPKLMPA
jgi:hypothetical protein